MKFDDYDNGNGNNNKDGEEEHGSENLIRSPPPPPKDLTAFPKPQMVSEVAGLLAPNLFMPIPDVSLFPIHSTFPQAPEVEKH